MLLLDEAEWTRERKVRATRKLAKVKKQNTRENNKELIPGGQGKEDELNMMLVQKRSSLFKKYLK